MNKKNIKQKILNLVLSGSLILGLSVGLSFTQNNVVQASDPIKITRLAGQDRFETSTKISQYFGREGYYVVLCNSEDYPDASTVAPLAKKFEAPILLVNKDNIPDNVKQELIRLKTKRVFIIGGKGVISNSVESQLNSLGIVVEERIAGQDRFETCAKIDHHLISSTSNAVYAVEDEDWRNALSLSGVSGWNQCPIVLVGKNGVSNSIKQNICNEFHNYFLVGETNNQNFVNNAINGLTSNGLAIKSLGNTKEDTNIEIYNTFENDINLEKVYLINSNDIPDAISLGYLTGLNGSMILFVNQNNLTPTENFLCDKASNIKELVVVGGEGVLSQSYINGLYDKINDAKNSQDAQKLSDQQRQWSKDNNISIQADPSKFTPEMQARIKKEDKLREYAIWLDKNGITKEQALNIAKTKTGNNDLDLLGEGFANNWYKLDTGKDISERRFYEFYNPKKLSEGIIYIVDKEDGTIYKEIEGQKNVYTLLK